MGLDDEERASRRCGMVTIGSAFPRWRGRTTGSRLAGNFLISTVSTVSELKKRWYFNEKQGHDGHDAKGLRIAVSCPLKTAVFQRKVDIGHAGHGNFIKSLRARKLNSFNYVRESVYVNMHTWAFVHGCYVSFHAHVGVYAHSRSCEWSWKNNACDM